jgi:hypothetical protein
MGELGAVFYRGPSLLTGDPIVGVLTGLEGGSHNPKTGPMVQAWILRADRAPTDAVRDGSDDAICGDCALRGEGVTGRTCYVTYWLGPLNVWKQLDAGGYLEATWPELQALLEGRSVRCGAYGDPAAIPFEVWQVLLATAAGWVCYTHQWRTCDPRLQAIAMASVDDERAFFEAGLRGWRTFRIRGASDPLIAGAECICPASAEAGHRTTCQGCQLCRGTNRRARSIAIVAHGKPGNVAAFYRSRAETR